MSRIQNNEKTYTHEDEEAKIERLTEQKYIIQADEGWQIESVRYGKADAQEDRRLTEHAFTAPAINSDDNKLTVRFEKTSSDGANAADKTDSKKSAGVRTGDSTNIGFYLSLTAASALLLIAVPALRRRQKSKK